MTDKIIKPGKIDKTDKKITKRASKSQRTHVRRLKQEARNTGVVYKKP
jgi:hypothetical protein